MARPSFLSPVCCGYDCYIVYKAALWWLRRRYGAPELPGWLISSLYGRDDDDDDVCGCSLGPLKWCKEKYELTAMYHKLRHLRHDVT